MKFLVYCIIYFILIIYSLTTKNELISEKNEEAAQKHTAITTAEELFKCSFLTASHATTDVSLNNIEVPLTSSPAPSCTPDYEPISPVKSSSPQSQSSQACSVDSLPHFNRGFGFPSPFHHSTILCINKTKIIIHQSSLKMLWMCILLQNSIFQLQRNVPLLTQIVLRIFWIWHLTFLAQLTMIWMLIATVYLTNTDAGANVSSCPATSSQSGSFLSALSDNGCGECILKDTELNSCREFQNQREILSTGSLRLLNWGLN